MRKPLLWLPVVAAAAVFAGCGPNNDVGFYAGGSFRVTIADPNAPNPAATTTTGFEFPQQTRVDPTPNTNMGLATTGVCQVGPAGRTVRITRVGGDANGLQGFNLTMPPWEQDSCSACQHGTLEVTVGNAVFTGVEDRSQPHPQCVFTTERNGSYGMQLSIVCDGLTTTTPNDTRIIAVNSQLTLDQCDGPPSSNP
jgi:hypothetical protein